MKENKIKNIKKNRRNGEKKTTIRKKDSICVVFLLRIWEWSIARCGPALLFFLGWLRDRSTSTCRHYFTEHIVSSHLQLQRSSSNYFSTFFWQKLASQGSVKSLWSFLFFELTRVYEYPLYNLDLTESNETCYIHFFKWVFRTQYVWRTTLSTRPNTWTSSLHFKTLLLCINHLFNTGLGLTFVPNDDDNFTKTFLYNTV